MDDLRVEIEVQGWHDITPAVAEMQLRELYARILPKGLAGYSTAGITARLVITVDAAVLHGHDPLVAVALGEPRPWSWRLTDADGRRMEARSSRVVRQEQIDSRRGPVAYYEFQLDRMSPPVPPPK